MTDIANTLDILDRLIRHDTVSRNPNLALINDMAGMFAAQGIKAQIFRDSAGTKANILATLGPAGPGGIMLAGHTDVVPVDGQDWTTEPFIATQKNARIYGRGAADMKGFIAVALALAPALSQSTLQRPVYFAFTYDEETGCFGAQALAEVLRRMAHLPACCIVGEPTNMQVVGGHKGKLSIDCHVHGAECHSAYNDHGVNAVEIASEVIVRLRAMQKRLREEGPRNDLFDPPYSTVHTGLVRGGTARNIVPRDCRFEVEIRNLPEDNPIAMIQEIEAATTRDLLLEMTRVSPDTGIDFKVQSDIPALTPNTDSDLIRQALIMTGSNRAGVVSFATEAGLYQRLGIQTIVCGPGDIAQAHRPDEFIALEQLTRCATFLRAMIAYQQSRP